MHKSHHSHVTTAVDQARASKIQQLWDAAQEIELQDNMYATTDVNDMLPQVFANRPSASRLPASRRNPEGHRAPLHQEPLQPGSSASGPVPVLSCGYATRDAALQHAKVQQLLAAAREIEHQDRLRAVIDHNAILSRSQANGPSTLSHHPISASHGTSRGQDIVPHQMPPPSRPSDSNLRPSYIARELARLRWRLQQLQAAKGEMEHQDYLHGLAAASTAAARANPAERDAYQKRKTCGESRKNMFEVRCLSCDAVFHTEFHLSGQLHGAHIDENLTEYLNSN